MGKVMETVDQTVTKFGKTDLERLGLFIEMPYMVGKRYQFPKMKLDKGVNMIPGGPKTKCGNMDGYFENEYRRLYEGEKPPKGPSRDRKMKSTIPFMPIGPTKKHSSPGDYYGTFYPQPCEHFSPKNVKIVRKGPLYGAATFVTSPGKKGGPGYTNICLNQYPEHKSDRNPKLERRKPPSKDTPMVTVHYPQPYFETNPFRESDGKIGPTYSVPKGKKAPSPGVFQPYGFNKDGFFNPFPEGGVDKYEPKKVKRPPTGIFVPPLREPKTLRHFLTIDLNTKIGVNQNTYKTFEPTFCKHLL